MIYHRLDLRDYKHDTIDVVDSLNRLDGFLKIPHGSREIIFSDEGVFLDGLPITKEMLIKDVTV